MNKNTFFLIKIQFCFIILLFKKIKTFIIISKHQGVKICDFVIFWKKQKTRHMHNLKGKLNTYLTIHLYVEWKQSGLNLYINIGI